MSGGSSVLALPMVEDDEEPTVVVYPKDESQEDKELEQLMTTGKPISEIKNKNNKNSNKTRIVSSSDDEELPYDIDNYVLRQGQDHVVDYYRKMREPKSPTIENLQPNLNLPKLSKSEKEKSEKEESEKPKERVDTTGPEPLSEAEVAARGFGQGMFTLGDEVVAIFKSIIHGTPFKEEFEKQQLVEEQAGKQSPVKYYTGMGVGGAASLMIPGIGPIVRTQQAINAVRGLKAAKDILQAAKTAGDAVKIAEATTAVNAARSALTKELIRGGAQSGFLSGAGASKATIAENPVDVAADALVGAVTGGITNVAIPRAAEKFAESKVGKPIAEAAGKGFEKVKEVAQKIWEGNKSWELFPGRPELQSIVNEMVKKGKSEGLTDTQILNNLKVEFGPNVLTKDLIEKAQSLGGRVEAAAKNAGLSDKQKTINAAASGKTGNRPEVRGLAPIPQLTDADFDRAQRQTGLLGVFKRAIAGSQRLTEFLDRPEQLARAKQAFESQTAEEAAHIKLLQQIDEGLSLSSEQKNQLNQLNNKKVDELQQKLKTLEDSIKSARDARTQERLKQELANADEELKLVNKISEYSKFITGIDETTKNNTDSVKIALQKNYESQSDQNLNEIRRVYNKTKDHAKLLSEMRDDRIQELQNIPAEADDIEKFMKIRSNLQGKLDEEGMGRVGSEPLNAAFGGDERYRKLNNWVKIKEQQKKYDTSLANKQWNESKGLTETTGGRDVDHYILNQGRPADPDEVPSIGDIVGVLYAGNKKISSSAHGTPLATIKRDVAKVLQEEMKDFDPKIYDLQRNMSRTMSDIKAIEKSPFMETGWVPVTGETGRVQTVPKKFIKTELPDITQVAEETKDAWQKLGLPTYEIEAVNKLADVQGISERLSKVEPNKLSGEIVKLKKTYEDRLNSLLNTKNKLSRENRIKEITIRKNERLSKDEIQSQIDSLNRKTQEGIDIIDQTVKDLQNARNEVLSGKSRLSETERQLASMYREAQGIPPTARDIGQAVVIGSKGQVPFSIGKVLIPSPETRIRFINKIRNRFANPALTSAVRAMIEKPITREMVTRLSEMHSVSEDELLKTLMETGIPIDQE